MVSANGSGGAGTQSGGTSGGAGGGILLEAPHITIVGGLFANGGGGACRDAEDGRNDEQPALGGQCPDLPDLGNGGNGGAGLALPTAGQNVDPSTSADRYGGSGGGAAGIIRINTGDGTFDRDPNALISPTPSTGTLQPL